MARRSSASRRSSHRGREDWLKIAARALADDGPASLQIEPLARRLGVTKGSFYWHFPDRQALLDALVDEWRRHGTSSIIDETDAAGGTAADRIRRLWARTSSDDGLGFELGLRDLARRDPTVAEAVADVDARRLAYLRGLFRRLTASPADAEARAMLFYSLLVGNHFIAERHGRFSRGRVLRNAVDALVTAADPNDPPG